MLASFIMLYACQKQLSGSVSRANPSISASTTNAATGEKVTFSVANAPAGTHLLWASTAAGAASFSANGAGSANISFSKPGTYTVTCYFVSGDAADSLPTYDTSWYPHDTVPNYPPPPPPIDSSGYPHDTTGYPHDTTGYPHDTTSYPHDTTGYPHDTTGYPHDTVPHNPPPHDSTTYPPHDSTYYPHDSTGLDSLIHANHGHIVGSVKIVITVH
jgi:hypothetical protein